MKARLGNYKTIDIDYKPMYIICKLDGTTEFKDNYLHDVPLEHLVFEFQGINLYGEIPILIYKELTLDEEIF